MNRFLNIAGVLTLAVAGTSLMSNGLRADDVTTTGGPQQTAVVNDSTHGDAVLSSTADTSVDGRTKAEIKSRLANIVNSAVTTNGFDELIGDLARGDRQRMGNDRYKDFSALHAAIDQFDRDFRAKYHQDFDVKSARFDDLQFQRTGDGHVTVSLAELRSGNLPVASNDLNNRVDRTMDLNNNDAKGNSGVATINTTDNGGRDFANSNVNGSYAANGTYAANANGNEVRPAYALSGSDQPVVTPREAARMYNVQGVDKRGMVVQVTKVKSNGDIVTEQIPQSRIHNADITLQPNKTVGWCMPMVVADNAQRIQPSGAHEGLDNDNTRVTRQENLAMANGESGSGNNYASNNYNNANTDMTGHSSDTARQPGNASGGTWNQTTGSYSMTGTDTTGNGTGVTSSASPLARDANGNVLTNQGTAAQNGRVGLMQDRADFVHESAMGNGWRLEIGDSATAQQLADALTRQLTELSANKANWPTDVNDAYRVVSRHVLTAVTAPAETHLTSEGQ